jgi:hypothetical protein
MCWCPTPAWALDDYAEDSVEDMGDTFSNPDNLNPMTWFGSNDDSSN